MLRKEVPEGAKYDIDSQFGSNKTLFKTRVHTFKNGYDKYIRTCDIHKDIKIYHQDAETDQAGIANYQVESGVSATKKRVPGYSVGKAKQFVLWEKGKLLIDTVFYPEFMTKSLRL